MKLAFGMPNMVQLKARGEPWEFDVTGADQQALAKLADQLGYDTISVPEHHIIPNEHVELSGAHYFHGYAGMGFFAGATSRIKINSCITILPLQNPIVTAKALSTIDWQSGGRCTVTFGVGWLKEEFEILGVDFHKRGRMADEYIAAMIELWTKEDPVFEGEFVNFKDVKFEPKPIQKPHLPIWFGGDADAVLRRAAKYAQGWWPFLTKPEDIPSRIDYIKSQPEYDGCELEIMYGLGTGSVGEGHVVQDDPNAWPGMTRDEIVDKLGWLKELGVTMSSVPTPQLASKDEFADYARWIMEEIKPRLD